MARYLVDTDILIDYSRLIEPTFSRMTAIARERHVVGICVVQLAEYYAGERRGRRPGMDVYLARLPCWPISPHAAIRAGEYRFALARRGRTVGVADALNAAVAWEMRATIVTRNGKDYPTPGIPILAF